MDGPAAPGASYAPGGSRPPMDGRGGCFSGNPSPHRRARSAPGHGRRGPAGPPAAGPRAARGGGAERCGTVRQLTPRRETARPPGGAAARPPRRPVVRWGGVSGGAAVGASRGPAVRAVVRRCVRWFGGACGGSAVRAVVRRCGAVVRRSGGAVRWSGGAVSGGAAAEPDGRPAAAERPAAGGPLVVRPGASRCVPVRAVPGSRGGRVRDGCPAGGAARARAPDGWSAQDEHDQGHRRGRLGEGPEDIARHPAEP